mmetsp:Transcript_72378/g.143715  ORF Transcript_72378/g.143715 Transcript_72378/m.143715 type:complete len:96 (-) Transcript_72378:27-314(-)
MGMAPCSYGAQALKRRRSASSTVSQSISQLAHIYSWPSSCPSKPKVRSINCLPPAIIPATHVTGTGITRAAAATLTAATFATATFTAATMLVLVL